MKNKTSGKEHITKYKVYGRVMRVINNFMNIVHKKGLSTLTLW
jgi:hypothetical protein